MCTSPTTTPHISKTKASKQTFTDTLKEFPNQKKRNWTERLDTIVKSKQILQMLKVNRLI